MAVVHWLIQMIHFVAFLLKIIAARSGSSSWCAGRCRASDMTSSWIAVLEGLILPLSLHQHSGRRRVHPIGLARRLGHILREALLRSRMTVEVKVIKKPGRTVAEQVYHSRDRQGPRRSRWVVSSRTPSGRRPRRKSTRSEIPGREGRVPGAFPRHSPSHPTHRRLATLRGMPLLQHGMPGAVHPHRARRVRAG